LVSDSDRFWRSLSCPFGCSTCKSLQLCTSCLNGFYLASDNLCYSSCPPRFFGNNYTKTCQICPYDCLTCDNFKNCLSCDPTNDKRRLFNGTNRCLPLPGYYENYSQICLSCPSKCTMCLSSQICSSCIDGYFLSISSTCESICQARSIIVAGSKQMSCQKCPYDC